MREWNLKWPYTAVGILFSIVFAGLSLGIIPACGQGTGVLIVASFGFYGVGLLFWPAVTFLLADLRSIVAKCLVPSLLLAHYAFLYAYLHRGGLEEKQRIVDTFYAYPQYMWPPAILYLTAHILIVVLYVRGVFFNRNAPSNKSLDRSGDSATRNLDGPAQTV